MEEAESEEGVDKLMDDSSLHNLAEGEHDSDRMRHEHEDNDDLDDDDMLEADSEIPLLQDVSPVYILGQTVCCHAPPITPLTTM